MDQNLRKIGYGNSRRLVKGGEYVIYVIISIKTNNTMNHRRVSENGDPSIKRYDDTT